MKVVQVSDLKENWKFENDRMRFQWIVYNVFEYHGMSSICVICMYVCMYFGIWKIGLFIEFHTHYNLLWVSFHKLGLIHDEWREEHELRTVDNLT